MDEERKVTLTELLDSREKRAAHQKELLAVYGQDGGILVSVTLNIPGPVKDRPVYRRVMEQSMESLSEAVASAGEEILFCQVRHLPTGPEGYLVTGGPLTGQRLKRLTVKLEDSSPLGRLFDMDVIDENGGISRGDLGFSPRRCLLCEKDAKVCARSQSHKREQLLAEIHRVIEEAGIY